MNPTTKEELACEAYLLSNRSAGETPFLSRVVGVLPERPAGRLDGIPDALDALDPVAQGGVRAVLLYGWAICAAFLLLCGLALCLSDFRQALGACLGW